MTNQISIRNKNSPKDIDLFLKQRIRLINSNYNNNTDLIAVININQEFVFANNTLLDTFNYTFQELKARKFSELFKILKESNNINKILHQADKCLWDGEVICSRKDNSTFDSKLKITSILDSNDSLCGYELLAANASGLKSNYEKLFGFLMGLEKSLYYFPDLKIEIDEDGQIIKFKYFTIESNYIDLKIEVSTKLEDILPHHIVNEIYLGINNIKSGQKIIFHEYSLNINKNEKIFEARLTSINENQYNIILRDITKIILAKRELKKTQDELGRVENLAKIGKMTSYLSHEIRSPLASLKNYVELLKNNSEMPESSKPMLSVLHNSISNLNRLLNNISLFSKDIDLIKVDINVHELLENVKELLAQKINKKNIEFNINLDISVIKGDFVSTRFVFFNLIENAVDAVSEFGVIEIKDRVSKGKYFIKIIDNGCGIAEPDRIFESFHSEKNNGTGLGLAIAKKIMEKHQGNINLLESRSGRTIFELQFPSVGIR